MGRETDESREARLKRAGRWLEAELKKRDWTQKYLAGELGVAPQQVSAYANGRYEIDPELARDVARLFGMTESDVWRGMQVPLPQDYEEPTRTPRPLSTLEAIAQDPNLDEETRQHFANQYRILTGLTEYRRQSDQPDAGLPPEEQTLAGLEPEPDPEPAKDEVRSGSRRRR